MADLINDRTLGMNSLSVLRGKAEEEPPLEGIYDIAKVALSNAYNRARDIRLKLEEKLEKCSLVITDPLNESELSRAITKYWPSSLGPNSMRIPYSMYIQLGNINESTAKYMRERFELAAGDVDGVDWLDAWEIAYITEREAWKAYFWLQDKGEGFYFVRRSAEVFAEWVDTAIDLLFNLERVLSGDLEQIQNMDGAEGGLVTTMEAKGGQAVARRRIRECSLEIRKAIDKLNQFIGDSILRFYDDYMSHVEGVERLVSLGINADTESRTMVLNSAYAQHLGYHQDLLNDLGRRHQIYFLEVTRVIDRMTERAMYKVLYSRLEKKGQSMLSSADTVKISEGDVPAEERIMSFSLLDYYQPPTETLKDAFKGSFGTPSKWNPFVTSNDPRLSSISSYLVSMPWSYGDPTSLAVHPDAIYQALYGIGGTVTGSSLTELTDGSETDLHVHLGLLPGHHADTHYEGATDPVYFSSLGRSAGDHTTHDLFTNTPHVSTTDKLDWDIAYSHASDGSIHLTAGQKTDLTDGGVTTAHTHSSSSLINTVEEVTGTSKSASVNTEYVTNNVGQVTVTLPATAVVGDKVYITGKGAGGWKIAQRAGQTIHFLGMNTTTGVVGYLASTTRYDCIEVTCITDNTDWIVSGVVGNITVN